MENVLNLIRAERERQNKKWGEQNHDDYRWLAILTEEVGEAAQAILHDEFGGSHAGTAKTELVHVAAVAVQWLECMERRQLTPLALDGGDSAPLQAESTPEVLSPSLSDSASRPAAQ